MADMSHLNALQLRLSNEREYLRQAKNDGERKLREVWISQIEREIASEYSFLGIAPSTVALSDEALLAEILS